jgi:hypothetical protein
MAEQRKNVNKSERDLPLFCLSASGPVIVLYPMF